MYRFGAGTMSAPVVNQAPTSESATPSTPVTPFTSAAAKASMRILCATAHPVLRIFLPCCGPHLHDFHGASFPVRPCGSTSTGSSGAARCGTSRVPPPSEHASTTVMRGAREFFLSVTGKTSTPSSSWRRQSPGTTTSRRQRLHAARMDPNGSGQQTTAGNIPPAPYSYPKGSSAPQWCAARRTEGSAPAWGAQAALRNRRSAIPQQPVGGNAKNCTVGPTCPST